MKKIIGLFALIASFTFLATTTTTAQNFVKNDTDCAFRVKIAYGDLASCTTTGTLSVIVPPSTQIAVAIPFDDRILASKGSPLGNNNLSSPCIYYISSTTCTYPYGTSDSPLCLSSCEGYTANLIDGFGLWFHN